jgi:hypothetical protein
VDRGYAKCYGCQEYIWNPIALWAKLRESTYSEALQDLKQSFGLKFLGATVQTQLKDWERHQTLKKKITDLCHSELINAINAPNDPNYLFAQETVNWLLNTRLIPRDAIPSLTMLGVVPPLAMILNALEDEERLEAMKLQDEAEANGTKALKPYAYSKAAGEYLSNLNGWIGSILFRLDVAPDAIGRLKLRRPNSKDMKFIDDAYEEDLGFFGLGWDQYKPMLGSQQKYVDGVYVVEGEFDALSIMARQTLAGGPTFVTVALGGNSQNDKIDNLRSAGFVKAFLFADRPGIKDGDKLIKGWLPEIKHLRAFVFSGYDQFPGQCGDPDEIICTVGLEALSKILLDTGNRALFQSPPDWVFEKAQPEIEVVPASDVRGRIEAASAWGRYLRNSIECDLYVDMCAKAMNLPAAQLKREIVAKEEDEPGFILRLADVLTQVFYPIGQRSSSSERRLVLWHKEKREIISIGLADDTSIERELGTKLGPSYQFFAEKVGIPPFLEVPDAIKEQGKYLQKIDKDYRFYYRQALTLISQTVPDFHTAEHKGQGFHAERSGDGAPSTLYLVNGRDVYQGQYNSQNELVWKKIDGPMLDGVVFDVGLEHPEEQWLKNVNSVADLDRANSIDPGVMWNDLHNILDKGWAFKNHTTTVDFLTSHLLATTINNAFRRQVVVIFNADTGAGKSKLNMGLISGSDFPRLRLISSAVGMQNFTPAGIRQTMDNKVRPLCLDEFEDEGSADKKQKAVSETLEMLRNLTGENNTYIMGSREGDPKKYKLSFFVFLSAINPARKVQDANRMIVVNMDKRDGRLGPDDIITNEIGWDKMDKLREDLSIGLFPHTARIQKLYEDIEVEFGKPGAKPINVDQRYFQALFPAMTIMKLLGKDYKQFAYDFCEANKTPLNVGADNTDSAQLFNWLTQSGHIRVHGEHGDTYANAIQLLATPEFRDKLNGSACGLFYDEPTELLVVNWTMAIQGVLRMHSRYAKETNTFNIREIANRSPLAIKSDELDHSGALERLKHHGLAGIPANHLTAYKVSHIVRGFNGANSPEQPTYETKVKAVKDTKDDGDFSAG